MITPGAVTCPQKGCGEDRPTLIHKITDPMGERFYCCVCGHEFRLRLETPDRQGIGDPRMKALPV